MSQKEFIGPNAIGKLADILSEVRPNNIFLVAGKSSYKTCGAEKKLEKLLKNFNLVYFNGFLPNPNINDVNNGIALFKKSKPDFVIAVGGGSVIDIAKAVNIISCQTGKPEDYIKGRALIERQGKPLVAVPTTSGSGSEATHFAVVYINGKKYSLAHHFIMPDYAIVDANLTLSLPIRITAETGMDALSQAIESYWAVGSTEKSKRYAQEAIKLILANLREATNQPNLHSRIAMSEAAYLAGKAINISKTTAPHAISYTLTYNHGIAHGHAVALTLGQMFIYNAKTDLYEINDPRGKRYVDSTTQELYKFLAVNSAEEACNLISNLMINIGLETRLTDFGLNDDDIKMAAGRVNLERLLNNPVRLTTATVKEILSSIK